MPQPEPSDHARQSEATRSVMQRLVDALNQHDWEAYQHAHTDDAVRHSGGRRTHVGVEGSRDAIERSWEAAPDWRYDVEVMLADGNLGALRVRAGGTFIRPYSFEPWGVTQPTGQRVEVTWMEVYRVENGQIVELWSNVDSLGLLIGLGLIHRPDAHATAEGGDQ